MACRVLFDSTLTTLTMATVLTELTVLTWREPEDGRHLTTIVSSVFIADACDLTLDPNTAGVRVILTEENKKAAYAQEEQPYPDNPDRFDGCQVLCEEGLTGRHYWEVECDSADVGVAYKSIDRVGDCSSEFTFGENEKSWCWFHSGYFSHNNSCVEFVGPPKYKNTIGVYLDWPAGILTFFEVFSDTLTHLYTVCTTFTEPLHPAFSFPYGSIHLCELK